MNSVYLINCSDRAHRYIPKEEAECPDASYVDRNGNDGLVLSVVVPVYKEEGNIEKLMPERAAASGRVNARSLPRNSRILSPVI